jgi:hypothetical protein
MSQHTWQKKLDELWARQPETLTDLEKLLRIDNLACLEFIDDIQLTTSYRPQWFFYLMLSLLVAYRKVNCIDPEALAVIQELLVYHAYMYKQATLVGSNTADTTKRIMQYAVLRKKLRTLLHEHVYRT